MRKEFQTNNFIEHFIRPITLLDTDMKIYSKRIANRIKDSIQNLINKIQTCSIKGRKLTDNLTILMIIISYYKVKRNKHASSLILDFQQARNCSTRKDNECY